MSTLNVLNVATAAGTAHTNSTDETAVATYSFPANAMQKAKVYGFECLVRATATNSTDTLTGKLTIVDSVGTYTVLTTSAVDVANGNYYSIRGTLTVRDTPSTTSAVQASVVYSDPGANGTAVKAAYSSLSLDTTAAMTLNVTADWSVANAGNSCQAEVFNVWEIA